MKIEPPLSQESPAIGAPAVSSGVRRAARSAEARREYHRAYHAKRAETDPDYRARASKRARENRKKNPALAEAGRAWLKAIRSTPEGWAKRTCQELKSRCKREGLPFNLEPSDIVPPTLCPVFNVPFTHEGRRNRKLSPSVDKLHPELGYVKGNVRVISWRANHLRNDCMDGDELRAVATYVDTIK